MTDQANPKIPFFKRPAFKNWINPLVRGFVKQVPVIGTPIVELASNLTKDKDAPAKHSKVSMFIQFGIAVLVIYDIVVNKGMNVKEGMEIIFNLFAAYQ